MNTTTTLASLASIVLLGLSPAYADSLYFHSDGAAFESGTISFKGIKASNRESEPFLGSLQDTTASDDRVHPGWLTAVPFSWEDKKSFVAGSSFLAATGGLPEGLTPVSWFGNFYTDTKAVTLQWQWDGIESSHPDSLLHDGGTSPGGTINFAGLLSGTGFAGPANVPEPATMSLLAAGAMGLMLRRRDIKAGNR